MNTKLLMASLGAVFVIAGVSMLLAGSTVHAVEVDGINTTSDNDLTMDEKMDGIEMYDGDGEGCDKSNGATSSHTKTDTSYT